jgi:uncharacterized protein (DUF2062 family)
MGMTLASMIRGNHLLAAVGTWISNPLTYVPLYWLNYKIGVLFLGGSHPQAEIGGLQAVELNTHGWNILSRLLLGSATTGIISGSIGWLGCLWLLKKNAKKHFHSIQSKQKQR